MEEAHWLIKSLNTEGAYVNSIHFLLGRINDMITHNCKGTGKHSSCLSIQFQAINLYYGEEKTLDSFLFLPQINVFVPFFWTQVGVLVCFVFLLFIYLVN